MQPTVLVINTGGTLGMKKDEMGRLAPVPGYFTSQMLIIGEETNSDEMPGFDIIEYGGWVDVGERGRRYHVIIDETICRTACIVRSRNTAKTIVRTCCSTHTNL